MDYTACSILSVGRKWIFMECLLAAFLIGSFVALNRLEFWLTTQALELFTLTPLIYSTVTLMVWHELLCLVEFGSRKLNAEE